MKYLVLLCLVFGFLSCAREKSSQNSSAPISERPAVQTADNDVGQNETEDVFPGNIVDETQTNGTSPVSTKKLSETYPYDDMFVSHDPMSPDDFSMIINFETAQSITSYDDTNPTDVLAYYIASAFRNDETAKEVMAPNEYVPADESFEKDRDSWNKYFKEKIIQVGIPVFFEEYEDTFHPNRLIVGFWVYILMNDEAMNDEVTFKVSAVVFKSMIDGKCMVAGISAGHP